MEIKSTKGVDNPVSGEKDYCITTTCGEKFDCVRNGKKWLCREQEFKNVKDIKQAILDGHFGSDRAVTTTTASETAVEPANVTQTWDCIDPCAHLVLLLGLCGVEPSKLHLETLDKYGWLTSKGELDIDRAKRCVHKRGAIQTPPNPIEPAVVEPDLSFI